MSTAIGNGKLGILTYNNHVAVLGDRLKGWRLAGYLAPETARRLQIDVVQVNNRVARVVQLQLKIVE